MTDENNTEIVIRPPSAEFIQMCDDFAQSFEKPRKIYEKLVQKGRTEGFNDVEIDILITSHLKGRIAGRTLYEYRHSFLELPKKSGRSAEIDDKKDIEESSTDEDNAIDTPSPEPPFTQEDIERIKREEEELKRELEQEQLEQEEQEPLAPYTATDDFMKREQEAEHTEQLLREERAKNAALTERLEQRDGELEAHAYKIQELSRRLTEATTIEVSENESNDNEVKKPQYTEHWTQTLNSKCAFCKKVTPWYIRHYISGKEIQLIDRERYKELYGMVPAEI